jgi:copper(I)-binding protein
MTHLLRVSGLLIKLLATRLGKPTTLAKSLVMAALLMSANVYAGDIQVENAWARATAPGQDAASVDMTITSKHAATLVGVSSRVAKTGQLHSMAMEGGMMRMREVEGIVLPAGKAVSLGESGYHLMLSGLKAPLKEGETVPLMLSIRVGKKRVVQVKAGAEVSSLTATSAPSQKMNPQQMKMQMN